MLCMSRWHNTVFVCAYMLVLVVCIPFACRSVFAIFEGCRDAHKSVFVKDLSSSSDSLCLHRALLFKNRGAGIMLQVSQCQTRHCQSTELCQSCHSSWIFNEKSCKKCKCLVWHCLLELQGHTAHLWCVCRGFYIHVCSVWQLSQYQSCEQNGSWINNGHDPGDILSTMLLLTVYWGSFPF